MYHNIFIQIVAYNLPAFSQKLQNPISVQYIRYRIRQWETMEFLSRQKLIEQEPPVMYTHVKRIRESILSHNNTKSPTTIGRTASE